ncbi:hypothetical protein HY570_03250 [Candidatus Micrarchaeota archaeon]|nr:hypothetical protein [Candidatus Micrarchaeota archaeon]
MYEEDIASINAEMRYITIELMKLAAKKNKSFDEIAREFIGNVYRLNRVISYKAKRNRKKAQYNKAMIEKK